MQQTVTFVQASSFYNATVAESTRSDIQNHVQQMTAEGWAIVSTVNPGYNQAPLIMFWRKD